MTFFEKNKLLIAILSVVIFVFGISVKAHAEVSQLDDTTQSSDSGGQHGEVITGITGTFESLTYRINQETSGGLTQLRIYNCDYMPTYDVAECNGYVVSSDQTDYNKSSLTWTAGMFGAPITFNKDLYYIFYNWNSHHEAKGSNNPDSFPNGKFFTSYLMNEDGNVKDAYFVLVGADTAPVDKIEITYPTSTAPYDFSQWEVNFETATSTTATSTDFYTIQIYTGATSSIITDLSAGTSYTFNVGDLSLNNTRIFNQNTTYYSEAELRYFKDVYQDVGDLVATSDMVTFTTTAVSEQESEDSYYSAPTGTSTSAEWTFTCDPESGLFENSLCNLARFLFVPTTASVERFGNLQNTINEKPPFGYWTEIKGEILTITTTTAAFTLTGVSVLAENDTFKTIKTTISVILWFLFAFWILHRVRLFDFQK